MNFSKKHLVFLIIILILIIDQTLKIWVKTSFAIGDEIRVIGNWFILHFTENPGMAFGLKFWGIWGKIGLSLFRVAAIIAIGWYLNHLIKQQVKTGIVIGLSLILAGAIGNIIDSAFYGYLFDSGMVYNNQLNQWVSYYGISKLNFEGYAGFLQGCVVDMFYFPIIDTILPSWIPFVGGEHFVFFRPVFNIADSSITIGVIYLLLFHRNDLFGPQQNHKS